MLLLLACESGSVVLSPKESLVIHDSLVGDSGDTVEVIPDDSGGGDSEALDEGWPKGCADLYDPGMVPVFNLEFPGNGWEELERQCRNYSQEYVPVVLHYGNESVEAMVRLKGNWSWSCDKMQFVVSFNEVDPDARFHGLRKLMFDAAWYDQTLLHERLAFSLFEARGLPYSCVNNAEIQVNGEFYGAYTNVERIDREYLERNFEEPDGNLYQGGSELKTNEDVGDIADLEALQGVVSVDELVGLMDLDEAVAEWAMEAMVPAMDNYWAGVEINYYLYDHPSQGFVYLPYDLDIAFGDSAYTDGSLIWPDALWSDPITYEHYGWKKEPLFMMVLADEYWCNRFVEELVLARGVYDPVVLGVQVSEWEDQIYDVVSRDSRKPFSTLAHERSVQDLIVFLEERAVVVDNWLGRDDVCPARW